MVRFVILRHGFSVANRDRFFGGQYDAPLVDLGIRQAACTAEYVLQNHRIDAIYSSDLSRAFDTAKPIADALGLPIQTDEQLRELDVGDWELRAFELVKNESPDLLAAYRLGRVPAPNGESYFDVQKRALEAFARIAAQNDGRTVLVATHGGLIRTLKCAWDNIPIEEVCVLKDVPNASVSVVNYDVATHCGTILSYGVREHLSKVDEI